jgi:hypothetical protein
MHRIYAEGLKLMPSPKFVRGSTLGLRASKPGPEMVSTRDHVVRTMGEAPGKKAVEKIMGDDNAIHVSWLVVPVMLGEVLVISPV